VVFLHPRKGLYRIAERMAADQFEEIAEGLFSIPMPRAKCGRECFAIEEFVSGRWETGKKCCRVEVNLTGALLSIGRGIPLHVDLRDSSVGKGQSGLPICVALLALGTYEPTPEMSAIQLRGAPAQGRLDQAGIPFHRTGRRSLGSRVTIVGFGSAGEERGEALRKNSLSGGLTANRRENVEQEESGHTRFGKS
jgi:hypothetical protein